MRNMRITREVITRMVLEGRGKIPKKEFIEECNIIEEFLKSGLCDITLGEDGQYYIEYMEKYKRTKTSTKEYGYKKSDVGLGLQYKRTKQSKSPRDGGVYEAEIEVGEGEQYKRIFGRN